MAAPVWITPPGSLGTIVEQEFYTIALSAENTSLFSYLSGVLPDGIRIAINGTVEGFPRSIDYIQGVPKEVGTDVTSEFVVRATSDDGLVADRVFTMTITGPDDPVIDTKPLADLGKYFDGDQVTISLTATDPDPLDTQAWNIIGGSLPTGLTLSTAGVISGYLLPTPSETGTPGYDVNNYDIGSYDFSTVSVSKDFEFTAQVTDSTNRADTRVYSMFIASRTLASADGTTFSADNNAYAVSDTTKLESRITADFDTRRNPYMVTQQADLGTVLHDNYYNFQFQGYDFDGDPLSYSITTGVALGFDSDEGYFDAESFDRGENSLPNGLELDEKSGWLTGTIPSQGAVTSDFTFGIKTFKADDVTYESELTFFTLRIVGSVAGTITWPTADLGTIATGAVSELTTTATVSNNTRVYYELKSGSANSLPQGLRVETNGLVTGRVAFEHMMFDTGTTTFDGLDFPLTSETTFERENKFNVRVYSEDLSIDTYQEFTIDILPNSYKPWESLYIRALPVSTQRDIYSELIQNSDDINPTDIYRNGDINFGIQTDIRVLIASGLNPVQNTDYIEAMSQNHYNSLLSFGDIKTSKAYNSDGTGKYDIVYVELTDTGIGIDPSTGEASPAAQSIDLHTQQSITSMTGFSKPIRVNDAWPKTDTGNLRASAGNLRYVYPNAIENMRKRLLENIGYGVLERLTLPQWMQDKQVDVDNKVIGWKLVAPIVYVQPGQGEKVAYLLAQRTTLDLKKISFEIDRFIIDNNLSAYYNKSTKVTYTADYYSRNGIAVSSGVITADSTAETVDNTREMYRANTSDSTLVNADYTTITADTYTEDKITADSEIIIADNEKFIPDPETTFDLVNSLTNPGFALKTTFDGGETRFFSGASKHTETIDEGDQYIAFPQRDLFR